MTIERLLSQSRNGQIWSEPLASTVNDAKTIWNTMQKNVEINFVEGCLKIQ